MSTSASLSNAHEERPAAVRRGGRLAGRVWGRDRSELAFGVLGVILAIGLWELVARVGLLSSDIAPPASDVFSELWRLARGAALWSAVGHTMAGWALGLLIGVVVGVAVGVVMGSSRLARRALHATVEFLRPVPGVALIPLSILVFGQTVKSDAFLVAFGTTWPMLFQAMYGVEAVDQVAQQTAHVFGLGRIDRIRFVVLPSALPYIATGLRICSAIALIIAVTSELVIGSPGLGMAISASQQGGAYVRMDAFILASGLLGVVINVLFSRFESQFLSWHQSQRSKVEL